MEWRRPCKLFDMHPEFRRRFERCSEIAEPLVGHRLVDVMRTGPADVERLGKPSVDAAIFAIEYAIAGLWMSYGVRPSAVTGYGVGEYVAACIAEVFSLEHALGLVREVPVPAPGA